MSGMICLCGAYCALRKGISVKGGKVANDVVLHNRFYNKNALLLGMVGIIFTIKR